MRDTTIPKFASQEKTLVVNIPSNTSKVYNVPVGLADKIEPSFNGKLISVNYKLSVHVKHDAWNEWGRGKGVSLPINISKP